MEWDEQAKLRLVKAILHLEQIESEDKEQYEHQLRAFRRVLARSRQRLSSIEEKLRQAQRPPQLN